MDSYCPGPDPYALDNDGLTITRTGGAVAWKCFVPPEGDDSSAAAELRNITTAIKYAVAARTIQADLDIDIAPTRPSDMYIDAQAVLEGAGAERMPKSSRWMGTRYAMVRYAEDSDTIKLRKIRGELNVADIVTKCLVGAPFILNRARILGLLHHPARDEATAEGTATAEKPPRPNEPLALTTRGAALATSEARSTRAEGTATAEKPPRPDEPKTPAANSTASATSGGRPERKAFAREPTPRGMGGTARRNL